MQRAILHIGFLVLTVWVNVSPATYWLVLPIWAVSFLAAIRNKSRDFDIIDLFWALNQLSFVVAPSSRLINPAGGIWFSPGVLMNLDVGQILYRTDQAVLLYFMIFVVSVINFLLLPKTYRQRTLRNFNLPFSLIGLTVLLIIAFVVEVNMRGGLLNTLAPRRLKVDATAGIFVIFSSASTLALAFLLAIRIKTSRSAMRYFSGAILASIILTLYNPFNASRFSIIQSILPIVLILFPRVQRFSFFVPVLAFSTVIIMPILSVTTRNGINADLATAQLSGTTFLLFLDQHVVLLHLIKMVQENGLQYGSSILSVVLFFVPRAIWPGKPLVLGLMVGNDLYSQRFIGTPNLSGPIFGDFYYDFGILGVVIGSIATAVFFRNILRIGYKVEDIPFYGYFIFSALPILFRGTVGAVLPLTAFTMIFFHLFLNVRIRLRIKKP